MTDIYKQTNEQEQPHRGYVHLKSLAHLDIVDLDDGEMPFIPKSTLLTRQESRTLLQAIAKVRNIGDPDNNHIEATLFDLWQRSRYFKRVYVRTLDAAMRSEASGDAGITAVSATKYAAPRSSYVVVDISDDGLEEGDADFRLSANVDEYMAAFFPYEAPRRDFESTINLWLVSIRARQVETSVSNGLWTLLARFI